MAGVELLVRLSERVGLAAVCKGRTEKVTGGVGERASADRCPRAIGY